MQRLRADYYRHAARIHSALSLLIRDPIAIVARSIGYCLPPAISVVPSTGHSLAFMLLITPRNYRIKSCDIIFVQDEGGARNEWLPPNTLLDRSQAAPVYSLAVRSFDRLLLILAEERYVD